MGASAIGFIAAPVSGARRRPRARGRRSRRRGAPPRGSTVGDVGADPDGVRQRGQDDGDEPKVRAASTKQDWPQLIPPERLAEPEQPALLLGEERVERGGRQDGAEGLREHELEALPRPDLAQEAARVGDGRVEVADARARRALQRQLRELRSDLAAAAAASKNSTS